MKALLIVISLLMGMLGLFAQDKQSAVLLIRTDVPLSTEHAREKVIYSKDSTLIQLNTIKFYISYVQLVKGKKVIYTENNSFHLIDFADTNTCQLKFTKSVLKNADMIQFYLGIDSTTNVSGAMGGDLDPTVGMYWTWQSGYINIKLEGTICTTTNKPKKFEYHLGGYSYPNASIQLVQLPIKKNTTPILYFKLKSILPMLLLSGKTSIMSPGQSAQRVSLLLSKCFSFE